MPGHRGSQQSPTVRSPSGILTNAATTGPRSGRGAVSTGGFGQGVGQTQNLSVPAPTGPLSGRDAVSTGGFGQGYGASDPYAGIDLDALNYRANTNARMVLPSADEQRAAIAAGGTAYSPDVTARIEQIRKNEAMVPTGTTDLHDRGYEEYFAPGGLYDQGVPSADPAAPAATAPAATAPAVAAPITTIETSYADMYGDMRDDAGTAFDT